MHISRSTNISKSLFTYQHSRHIRLHVIYNCKSTSTYPLSMSETSRFFATAPRVTRSSTRSRFVNNPEVKPAPVTKDNLPTVISKFYVDDEGNRLPFRSRTKREASRASSVKRESSVKGEVSVKADPDSESDARRKLSKPIKREPKVKSETLQIPDLEDVPRRTSKRQRTTVTRASPVYKESDAEGSNSNDSILSPPASDSDSDSFASASDSDGPRGRGKATSKSVAGRKRSAVGRVKAPPRSLNKKKPAIKLQPSGSTPPLGTAPENWEELYNTVLKMRRSGGVAANAAVDTMGCATLADPLAPEKDQRFHTLVALMLSSQTKDTVTAVVMKKLQTELPGTDGAPAGLTVANVIAVDANKLNEMIWAVGFHNNKTRYIKQAAEICRDQYGGDIPDTIEGLVALPGVGPKMAHLCLSHAWGRTEGIGVDVHVHRISNMWGWVKTKNPEETRKALESWLPRDKWAEINWLLVGFGQTVCPAVGKGDCSSCEAGLRGLCRAADRRKVAKGLEWVEMGRVQAVALGVDMDLGGDGDGVKVEVKAKREEEEKKKKKENIKIEVTDLEIKIKDEET